MMRLNPTNFFTHFFLLDHQNPELDKQDQDLALGCSIALGILSLGTVHATCALIRWCIAPANKSDEVTQSADLVGRNALPKNGENEQKQKENKPETPAKKETLKEKEKEIHIASPPKMTAEEKEFVRRINQEKESLTKLFDSWGAAINFLASCGKELIYLELSNFNDHPITNNDCGKITEFCCNLQHIVIHSTGITDDALACFKEMNDLTHVDFSWCEKLTDKGVEHLKGMPLREIRLVRCNKLTDKGLKNLEEMKNLTQLDLSGCENLTDEGIGYLKGMPLRELRLGWCEKLTDKGLKNLEEMKNLTQLDLSGCENLTDEGIGYLKGMPLREILLCGCEKLTDKGVAHLKGMPLTCVDLRECKELTDISLEHLTGMKNLSYAYFSGCEKMTDEGFRKLKENIPSIESDMLPEED